MIGLETCYMVLKTAMPEVKEERWVELLSTSARKIFGLSQSSVNTGEKACITVFNPAGKTNIEASFFYSRSRNSPFIGKELNGSVLGTVLNDALFLRK
jgi:dihydroorotase